MLSELFRLDRIMGFCEKVCYFVAINFLFLLSSAPVLLFFLFVGISQVRLYLPLFLLCVLSAVPSLSAVFYSMRRLTDGRERGAWKDYWQGYRTDLKQKLFLGAGQLFAIFVLWTNIEFFTKQFYCLPIVLAFGLLFAFTLIITPNLYLLASRYRMSNLAIVKTACVLTITRPVCTLGSIAALGVVLMALELAAGTSVIFMISIYGFLVVFISRKMLNALETEQE